MELVKRVAILLLCSTATVTKTNGSSMGTIAKDWESHYAIRYDGERSYSRIGSVAQVGALGAAATGPGKSWSGYPESNTRRLHGRSPACGAKCPETKITPFSCHFNSIYRGYNFRTELDQMYPLCLRARAEALCKSPRT